MNDKLHPSMRAAVDKFNASLDEAYREFDRTFGQTNDFRFPRSNFDRAVKESRTIIVDAALALAQDTLKFAKEVIDRA